MSTPTIHNVVDLTFGDAGKGVTVQRLAHLFGEANKTFVIRHSGGGQCAHAVAFEGKTHVFSQYGSATLIGGKTYFGPSALFHPLMFALESSRLTELSIGLDNPKKLFYLDKNCLVTTVYHQIVNQILECARGNDRHGSCGLGIGETKNIFLKDPTLSLRVSDLTSSLGYLVIQLEDLKNYYWSEVVKPILSKIPSHRAGRVRALLQDFRQDINTVADVTQQAIQDVNLVETTEIAGIIGNSTCIGEGNQGILIDQHYGFHPYSTWTDCTSKSLYELVETAGLPHKIIDYGVCRTFLTRHGPGPFPTEKTEFTTKFNEAYNKDNCWQGPFRIGHQDFSLLNYAVKANRGIDRLVITHTDWLRSDPYYYSDRYEEEQSISFLKHPNYIQQKAVTQKLIKYRPILNKHNGTTLASHIDLFADKLNTPVFMTGHGPDLENYYIVGS